MGLVIRTTGFDDYLAKSGGAYIKCLILGEPDAGKTRSASFWPNPIFADCEQGRMSIADRGVPYAEIKSSADFEALVQHLKLECQKPVEKRKYSTLVIDTIDSYQRILINERLKAERKESLSGWADWGFLDAKMTAGLTAALNLPMNVVVNLHIKDEGDGDEDSKRQIKKPKLKGDIKDQIAGEFDLIGYLEKSYVADGGKRVLKRQIRWHSEPRYPVAKDRSGRLDRYTDIDFTPADYLRIYNSIVGDHVEAFPDSATVEELDNGVAEPAGPEEKGGPVAVDPIPMPRAKKPPAKKAAPKTAGTKPVPPKDEAPAEAEQPAQEPAPEAQDAAAPATEEMVAPEVEVSEEEAVQNVQDAIDGSTVVEESAEAEATEPPAQERTDVSGPTCGDQPAHFAKETAVNGCGKGLAEESRDAVNLRLIKTKTYLCSACFTAWKAAS